MKRSSIYGLAAVILIVAGGGAFAWWSNARDQLCIDATRTQNLFTIAQMVQDYHDEQSRYPFQASGAVEAMALDGAFFDEIERVLGEKNTRGLTGSLTAYDYRVDQDGYTLTTHLYNSVPQTKELGPNRHRLQLGSSYDPAQKLYPFVDISVNSILAASQAVADSCN